MKKHIKEVELNKYKKVTFIAKDRTKCITNVKHNGYETTVRIGKTNITLYVHKDCDGWTSVEPKTGVFIRYNRTRASCITSTIDTIKQEGIASYYKHIKLILRRQQKNQTS